MRPPITCHSLLTCINGVVLLSSECENDNGNGTQDSGCSAELPLCQAGDDTVGDACAGEEAG